MKYERQDLATGKVAQLNALFGTQSARFWPSGATWRRPIR